MNRRIAISISAAVLALSAPLVGLAAYGGTNPESHDEGQPVSVMFQNGGRDAASRERMNNAARDFDLRLSVSGKPASEDWGDVEVKIFDPQHKNVLTQRLVGGPLLYLSLPKGDYQIIAKDPAGRRAEIRQVKVSPDRPLPLDLKIKG
jgi:hypothetical protein